MIHFGGLRGIFQSGQMPCVVSDSNAVLEKFSQRGFPILSFDRIRIGGVTAPAEVILITASSGTHPDPAMQSLLKQSAVLVISLLAFCTSERALDYLIYKLEGLDFITACKKSRWAVELFQHVDQPIEVRSDDKRLTIALGNNVDVSAPKLDPGISPGEWISIIQYLEVGMVPNFDRKSFEVNGQLVVHGVTIAHHLHSHSKSGPFADEAWSILSGLRAAGRFPLVLKVVDSEVTAILSRDGEDFVNRILPLTDETLRGRLTEVSIGSLEPSLETDWSINSQLNEPAGGIHLGIGAGEEAAHIDFVSPYAEILVCS